MTTTSPVRPFPWESLDRATQADARALREVRAWGQAHADLGRLPGVLAELLGAEVDVRVRAAGPVASARGLEGGAAVLLARAEAPAAERAMLVQAEPALVASALRRVVQRPAPFALDPGAPLEGDAIGAFAAIVAAAARRAHAGAAMRVLAVGPAPAMEAHFFQGVADLWSVTLTMLVDHDAFEARLVVPRSAVLGAPSRPWDASWLAELGATPLEVPLVAWAARLSVAEVASLGAGDVLVLSPWPLARAAAGLTGPVHLAAPAAQAGFRAELGEDGRLVLLGELEPLAAAEADMGEAVDRGELIDAVGDVPVLLRVEIGEARMAARDWAAVGRGDVLSLGRRVGEQVILRVGGVAVARGDLVEVDGEVGVRIVERVAAEGAKR